jgi:hypothetical protein
VQRKPHLLCTVMLLEGKWMQYSSRRCQDPSNARCRLVRRSLGGLRRNALKPMSVCFHRRSLNTVTLEAISRRMVSLVVDFVVRGLRTGYCLQLTSARVPRIAVLLQNPTRSQDTVDVAMSLERRVLPDRHS